MKLRVRNNSIRLRLSQSEVRKLKETGAIEETIEFGENSRFAYILIAAESDSIKARFENGKITVSVPPTEVRSWANSEQIGLETKQSINDEKFLRILIEKDLASDK